MTAHWHYQETAPFFQQGRDHARNNFSREERSSLAILIRETLQNALDARADENQGAVRVVIRSLRSGDYDGSFMTRLIDSEFRKHLVASGAPDLVQNNQASVLTIEDFGTKGLLGNFEDCNLDGPGENWNAFWHREGEGAKGKASNGGAGQGKITYFKHSAAGVVFAITTRSSDSRRLLMGKGSFLRDYVYGDKKFYRAAFWTTSDRSPSPEVSEGSLSAFSAAFRLERTSNAPGLSLMIPFAGQFDAVEAIRSVILDFYLPIAGGRLEVQIGDLLIDSISIDEISAKHLPDEVVIEQGSSFTKEYRAFSRAILTAPPAFASLESHWSKQSAIPDDAFPAESLATLRESLHKGDCVAIKLPIQVRRKDGAQTMTSFEVYLQLPPALASNEEAFVRQDLLIGGESHIAASAFVEKARSLTWIRDQDLSEFLLAAEEPTHLKWNASLARDKGMYSNPEPILRAIRQAVPRLLTTLLKGSKEKDVRSLARFFSKPATAESKSSGQANAASKKPEGPPKDLMPPESNAKPIRIEGVGNRIRVLPRTSKSLADAVFPIRSILELAYEGLGQNAFADYDPFDFDLADSQYPVSGTGIAIAAKLRNRIEFEITDKNFFLEVSGFSPHIRIRARLQTNDKNADATSEGDE